MKLKEYITKFYPLIDLTDVLIFIAQGKALVNNQVIKNPNFIVSEEDVVEILLPKNYVKNAKLKKNKIDEFLNNDEKLEFGSFFSKPASELLQETTFLNKEDKEDDGGSYYTIKIPKLKIFNKKLREEKKLKRMITKQEKEKIKKKKN